MATHAVSHIDEEARVPLLLFMRKVVVVGCPQHGCQYTASALSEGRAIRSLATHLVNAHLREANRAHHQ